MMMQPATFNFIITLTECLQCHYSEIRHMLAIRSDLVAKNRIIGLKT
jgi:hypothetical protein